MNAVSSWALSRVEFKCVDATLDIRGSQATEPSWSRPERRRQSTTVAIQHICCILCSNANLGQSDRETVAGGRLEVQKSVRISREAREQSKIAIVPVHGNKDLGRGLVRKIEKETGIKLS